MSTESTPPTAARPGRRRSEESRRAILVAAFELIGEVGYAGLTIEGIATRAGCGKQTIYRWWRSKADVLLDALSAKGELYITTADHGSYRDDLRAFLADTYRLAGHRQVTDVLRALMAEAQIDAEFGERFRTGFLERRRDALRVILDRAAHRGDLPAQPEPSTVLDLVFGTLWYRVLTARPVEGGLADELLAVLAPDLGRGSPPAGRGGRT
ncbi:TetR/AcrR family transcriptional regulator [Streptomyces sp. NPDC058231]|uniref:TetR/AcrR family transcriptional regulator n=1 Tax=Streptomyces sp. NPDC058231 TaxID=3346392 RepID=UPI0036E147F7